MIRDIKNTQQLKSLFEDLNTIVQSKPITIEVSETKNKINRKMQNYLYSVLYPYILQILKLKDADYETYSKEEVDYLMRIAFHFRLVQPKNKPAFRIPKTLKLTKSNEDEVMGYFNKLIAFAAEEGVVIPPPKRYGYEI